MEKKERRRGDEINSRAETRGTSPRGDVLLTND